MGAPIFGLDQTVVAAVSIAGPTFRMKEELDVMTRAVKATAANISRLMGGAAVTRPVFQLSGAGAHKDSRSCCFYFRFRNSSGSLQPRPFPRSVARIWGGWSR